MKIKVAELFFFLDMGGVERNIVDIINFLPSSLFEKTVIISHRSGLMRSQLHPDVQFVQLPDEDKMLTLISLLQPFDICHIHTVNQNPFFAWSAALAGKPVILNSIESTVYFPYSAHVDYTTCVAKHIYNMQSNLLDSQVIYNGTAVDSLPRSKSVDHGRLILVEMHRPDKEMAASLVDLIPYIKSRHPEVEGWILGIEGQSTESLKYWGKVAEPNPYLRQADFLVHLPGHEAFSNALIEAMASGALPIVSNVGGNVEMVEQGRNGFILTLGQENNPKKVAAAISDILTRYKNSPELFSNIRNLAFQTVKQKFNAVRMRQSYQELMIN
ncbi:MAG: glycosyltransferase, partial [Calditrichaeota bacterium]